MNRAIKLTVVTVAAAVAVALTLSLGLWQLDRAAQKESLQADMDRQSAKAPLTEAGLLAAPDPTVLVYQRARLRGTWVQGHTVLLENRQMNTRVGFFAMTPFLLQGGRAAILVQRGWLARNFEDRTQIPAITTPAGTVEIEGRIAPPPSRLYEPGVPGYGAIRQNLDLVQFQAETQLPLMAVTLQQSGAPSDGLLREWPAVNVGVDKHYGYALQWFAIAALVAALYLWFQVVRRFIHRPKDFPPHV